MAAALVGHGAFVKLGKEATYGQAASTTISNRINDVSLSKNQERNEKANLSVPASGVLGGLYDGFRTVQGSISMPVHYKGLGLLFLLAMGDVNTTGSQAPYTHEYVPNINLPSATIDVQRGSGISNQMEKFTGVKVSRLAISCEAGGEMTAAVDFIGQSSQARAANITSSFGTGSSVLHFHAGQLSFGGNNYDCASMNFVIENNVEPRNNLGSKETAEPTVGDVRRITLEVTVDIENNNLFDAYQNGTQGDAEISFVSGNDQIKFKVTNSLITSFADPVSGFSRVQQTLTLTGLADSSNEGGVLTLINDDSTGEGN